MAQITGISIRRLENVHHLWETLTLVIFFLFIFSFFRFFFLIYGKFFFYQGCVSLLYVWAVGSNSLILPPQAGKKEKLSLFVIAILC